MADEGDLKGVKKARSLSSHTSSSSLTSLPPTTKKKININNDEYWSKLESRNKNPSSSAIESDRRRQNLRDAIDGLDVLRHISHEDDGEGVPENGDGQNQSTAFMEDRDLRMASLGLVTGKSSLVGTRRLFDVSYTSSQTSTMDEDSINCPQTSQPCYFSLFQDVEQCMQELKAIIEMMDKAAPRSLKASKKKMWNHVRTKIIDPIKKAVDVDLLPEILERGGMWKKKNTLHERINGDVSLVVPFNLVRWLVRTSLSGKTVGTQLCLGAHIASSKILERNDVKIMSTGSEILKDSINVEGIIVHVFHVKDFVSILGSEFGLWTREGCLPMPQCGKEPNVTQDRSFGNEFGLKNALELWAVALDNDFVTCDGDFSASFSKDSWDFNGTCICSITAKLVAMICRSGIDPSFHAGYRLRQPQGQLINSIFDWMERSFHSKQNGIDYLQKWIEHTAEISTRSCSNLPSTAIRNGESISDNRGWLSLILAIQTYHIVDQTNEIVTVFFAYFVCRAAKLCMEDDVENWDSKVEKNVTALIKDVTKEGEEDFSISRPSNDLRIKCVVTSEIILESIKQVGEKITRESARFLAAVNLVVCCELIGVALFNFNAKISENPSGIYESKAEAAAMCDHYERLENLSTAVKKLVHSVLSDKNMMRVKELLSLISAFFRHYKSNASTLSNRCGSKASKQQRMDVYVKGNSPDEPEQ